MALWAGQSIAAIHDLPSAEEVVRRIANEAQTTLDRLANP
jgi:NAD(P)H-dependent flavin oxidoreductase YrpB (nitropropane dioxygenase family)